MQHQPPPPEWPQISASLFYRDPAAAIAWLCKAFEFEVKIKVEGQDGSIVHSELVYGQGLVMVAGAARPGMGFEPGQEYRRLFASPLDLEHRHNQAMFMYVDDVEAHHARALEHGAKVFMALTTNDYGPDYWTDRSYGAYDCEGHLWWFSQRLRTG